MRRSTGRSPWSRKTRRAPPEGTPVNERRAGSSRPTESAAAGTNGRMISAPTEWAVTRRLRGAPRPFGGRHRRRPGGPGWYSAAAVRACRVIDAGRPRRGSACHETKKGTGRGCTPGSCFVCTAFRRHEPPYWGVQGGRSPPALLSPHFFGKKWGRPPRRHPPGGLASTRRADTIRPYGLGSWRTALVRPAPWQTAGRVVPHRWGARRAGIGEPLIRPSARTGAPSPRWGEGSGRAMRAPRGHARFRAKKYAARDTGGACVYRSSRKYAKPRLAGGCLSRLLRREVKISTTTVTT